MGGVVRPLMIYTQFRYHGETDEQFEARCRAIEEANRRADEIERAWAPGPMKGLKAGWDCGCPQYHEHHGCANTACPRRE